VNRGFGIDISETEESERAAMVRRIRIEYPGAAYQVMAPGNQERLICADDLDRKIWLTTLGETVAKRIWRGGCWSWGSGLGDESGVSLGIRLVKEESDAELEKTRKRLLSVTSASMR
jgi:hypothetical protein